MNNIGDRAISEYSTARRRFLASIESMRDSLDRWQNSAMNNRPTNTGVGVVFEELLTQRGKYDALIETITDHGAFAVTLQFDKKD